MSRTQSQDRTRNNADDRAGDPTPVTGGLKTPARLLRSVPGLDGPAPANPLDKHILQLIALHKNVAEKFQDVDLANMDDAAKRAILADMQRFLGIKPIPFPIS